MTYSQPQQQQAQYRPNRSALWVNDRKSSPSQPDYKGNIEISYALAQELLAAFNAGQYEQDKGGQPCIKLDFGLYVQQGGQTASGKNKPVLSGFLSTVTETQQSRAARQQAAAQYQQQQPQQYAPPQQPQQYAPQPPQPEQAPQYQQIPPAPAPMPQQLPQQAYQQPPAPPAQAPVAPPAPGMAPMPGAIHGMPPMAPAPTPNLPQGF